jgi:Erv1 / Alr family
MLNRMSWGPILWSILHTSAEHLGKARPALLQTDETNRWMFLLKTVGKVMPCNVCRKHYAEWLKKSPISQFTKLRGLDLRDRARKWLYDLHENVNVSRGVVSGITLEDLSSMYISLAKYQANIEQFSELTRDNVQHGLLKMEDTQQFRIHLQYLRKITDTA